jgi:uncharacterized damage-inducible protein DinB
MMQDYSRIANLLGGSGVDPKKRKEIMKMVEKIFNMYGEECAANEKLRDAISELNRKKKELERQLAEAVTGKQDFKKYARLVESKSYEKLEKIREILTEEDFDWEDFYGEDN